LVHPAAKQPSDFLLSVPAGEVESAHRRHVHSLLIPQSRHLLTGRLDLEKIFGRKAPFRVDLGCGDGSFIRALAERMRVKNFLGIERLLGRFRRATRKAATIGNVRLLRMESSYAVRYLLPAGSVETFYLLFPDPWPKRRHWRRRIVTAEFLRAISDALVGNGRLLIATDHLEYFEKIKDIARANPDFTIADPLLATSVGAALNDLPPTKFWQQFRAQGAAIYRLELRKVSPVR
jgi:tRNA (guanine-N7-)-methyltransferase